MDGLDSVALSNDYAHLSLDQSDSDPARNRPQALYRYPARRLPGISPCFFCFSSIRLRPAAAMDSTGNLDHAIWMSEEQIPRDTSVCIQHFVQKVEVKIAGAFDELLAFRAHVPQQALCGQLHTWGCKLPLGEWLARLKRLTRFAPLSVDKHQCFWHIWPPF
jgi:hypothetical protein